MGGVIWQPIICQIGVNPMSEQQDANSLVERREALCAALADIGEFRPGTLQSRYRKCGKPTCHCAREGDPGHGPKWVLTRTVDGGRRNWSIPEAALADTRAQVTEYRRFRQLTREWIEVSERLCAARLERRHPAEPGKRGRSTPRSGRG